LAYHERTKHRPGRYARSLGYLDWDNQPDPFLRYEGAPLLRFERAELAEGPRFDALMAGQLPDPAPIHARSLGSLFFHSLALSAWKSAGAHRWSLRVNPSSGNLHPTEAYVVSGPIDGLSDVPSLHHYTPYEHGLELRAKLRPEAWHALSSEMPADAFLVGLTSIPWRESWKYGERAFRYCQHDMGHATAAVSLGAAMLGWRCSLLDSLSDDCLRAGLGLAEDRGEEREIPEALLLIQPTGDVLPWRAPSSLAALVAGLQADDYIGSPSSLSPSHQAWPVIEDVLIASRRLGGEQGPRPTAKEAVLLGSARPALAPEIVRRRRSAVAMDRRATLARETFYPMLCRLLPSAGHPVFHGLPWRPQVHLAIFVHRVSQLPSGLYLLLREQDDEELLRAQLDPGFDWAKPPGCPEEVGLWCLQEADLRQLAGAVSCHQDIAADGVFSVGMLARFDRVAEQPWLYRRRFWECGAIGQVLYLEAEAAGLRGTGIGCFFDDAVHDLLGLRTPSFQSLYHFGVGKPVDDPRLDTLPAYHHLDDPGA